MTASMEQERGKKLDRLVTPDEICARLGLTSTELFWLVSVKKLPGWLVGGGWKFDPESVDAWAASCGGVREVKSFVDAAMRAHRDGAGPGLESGSGGG